MAKPAQAETAQLVLAMSRGDIDKAEATNQIFGLVHDELHPLASYLMRRERPDRSVQPTALVNEASCMGQDRG
jgi:hypothetical protein